MLLHDCGCSVGYSVVTAVVCCYCSSVGYRSGVFVEQRSHCSSVAYSVVAAVVCVVVLLLSQCKLVE